MPDFSKGSTFNKDANFQGVRFGADAPLLETELNELQDIQTEARADIIRDTTFSGFVKLGELDFDYMLLNENCLKFKSDSLAYVHGYRIEIPKGTIVDIAGAPDKDVREDLVFLEVWKEEITKDSKLTNTGGDGLLEIPNSLQDSRVGQETARRIALRWRVRYWTEANFSNDVSVDGFRKPGNAWLGSNYPCAQGGNNAPLLETSGTGYNIIFSPDEVQWDNPNRNWDTLDSGLYFCGNGTDGCKQLLKTSDGYCYALPMFKIVRKPSCGKMTPFEYQKINPKADFSKFKSLITKDRVESIIKEKALGRSIVNLAPSSTMEVVNESTAYSFQEFAFNAKRNTTYTIIADITSMNVNVNSTCFVGFMFTRNGATFVYDNYPELRINREGRVCGTLRTKDVEITPDYPVKFRLFMDKSLYGDKNKVIAENIILVEGDLTSEVNQLTKLPLGISSIGESNNIVNFRSNILTKDSYDPSVNIIKAPMNTGLNTLFSECTVNPVLEAQLKRGDLKLKDITTFDPLSDLIGDEHLHLNKIKGRTLHNLVSGLYCQYGGFTKINENSFQIDLPTNSYPHYRVNVHYKQLKPNTSYTIIYDYESNLVNGASYYVNKVDSYDKAMSVSLPNGDYKIDFSSSPNGTVKAHFTTGKTYDNTKTRAIEIALIMTAPATESGLYFRAKNIRVYEGDHTSKPLWELPFVNGIESVGEYDNKVIFNKGSKNLIDLNNMFVHNQVTLDLENKCLIGSTDTYNEVQFYAYLQQGKTYRLTLNGHNLHATNLQVLKGKTTGYSSSLLCKNVSIKGNGVVEFREESGWYSLHTPNLRGKITDIMLIEGNNTTPFQESSNYKQIITLKEPLRALPNGACDIVDGNIVTRKVGKITLDGSSDEGWGEPVLNTNGDYARFEINYLFNHNGAKDGDCVYNGGSNVICNNYEISLVNDMGLATDREYISLFSNTNRGQLRVWVKCSNLTSVDSAGLKKLLNSSPMIIYYELEMPKQELIEPNYDMESIKTYKLLEPLRGIPNGACDTIEGDKVIRRVGEVILDGSSDESWSVGYGGVGGTVNKFETSLQKCGFTDGSNFPALCDRFNFQAVSGVPDYWGFRISHSINNRASFALFNIPTNVVALHDISAWRTWLSQNPIKILYPLDVEKIEPLIEVQTGIEDLTESSYFGKTYITNGTCDIITGDVLCSKSGAQTDFRVINEKAIVDDCNYKKTPYGDDFILSSRTENLFSEEVCTPNKRGNNVTVSKNEDGSYKVTMGSTTQGDWGLSTYHQSKKPLLLPNLRKGTTIYAKADGDFDNIWISFKRVSESTYYSKTFGKSLSYTLEEDYEYVEIVFNKYVTDSSYTVKNIMIGYGQVPGQYIPFEPCNRVKEVVKESDIEDLRHQISLTGFNYEELLSNSIDKLLTGGL